MQNQLFDALLWVLTATIFFAAIGQMFSSLHTAHDGTVPEVRLQQAMRLNAKLALGFAGIWIYGYWSEDFDQLPVATGTLGLCNIIIIEFLIRRLMLTPQSKNL